MEWVFADTFPSLRSHAALLIPLAWNAVPSRERDNYRHRRADHANPPNARPHPARALLLAFTVCASASADSSA